MLRARVQTTGFVRSALARAGVGLTHALANVEQRPLALVVAHFFRGLVEAAGFVRGAVATARGAQTHVGAGRGVIPLPLRVTGFYGLRIEAVGRTGHAHAVTRSIDAGEFAVTRFPDTTVAGFYGGAVCATARRGAVRTTFDAIVPVAPQRAVDGVAPFPGVVAGSYAVVVDACGGLWTTVPRALASDADVGAFDSVVPIARCVARQ